VAAFHAVKIEDLPGHPSCKEDRRSILRTSDLHHRLRRTNANSQAISAIARIRVPCWDGRETISPWTSGYFFWLLRSITLILRLS
jgi:hypothetical protein